MGRPDPLKFGRDQIMERVFDEDYKSLFSFDWGLAVAAGLIPSALVINKFGQNIDIDQSQDNDIWDLGGTYPFPSNATMMTISSASPSDDAGDNGAITMDLFSLDDDLNPSSGDLETAITVTMNGQSGVTIGSETIERFYRGFVKTAGSLESAAGTIYVGYGTITAGVPVNKVGAILPENNQTLMAIMTVPSGYTGYLARYYGGFNGLTGTARFGELHLETRDAGGVFRIRSHIGITTTTPPFNPNLKYPIKVNAGCDIKMNVHDVSADNLNASAGFDLVLLRNTN